MLKPRPYLCNRVQFRDIATKSGNPGHNQDVGINSRTVPAIPGQLATMCLRAVQNNSRHTEARQRAYKMITLPLVHAPEVISFLVTCIISPNCRVQ